MSTSDSGLRDDVTADLNPAGPGQDSGPQPAQIPERPADTASRDAWINYVVALGADRTFVTADTGHFDGVEYATEPGFTKARLIELADHLGG